MSAVKIISMLNRKARRRLAVLGVLIIINTVLETATIGLIIPFVSIAQTPGIVLSNHYLAWAYHGLNFNSPGQFILLAGIGLLTILVAKNIYGFLIASFQASLGYSQMHSASIKLFTQFLEAKSTRSSADRISIIEIFTEITFGWQGLFAVLVIATEGMVVIGMLGLLLFFEPLLTILISLIIGCSVWITTSVIKRSIIKLSNQIAQTRSNRIEFVSGVLDECFDAMKIDGGEDEFLSTFRQMTATLMRAIKRTYLLGQLPRPILETSIGGTVIGIIIIMLLQHRDPAQSFQTFGLFAAAAFRLMPSVNRITVAWHQLKSSSGMIDRVHAELGGPGVKMRFNHKHRDFALLIISFLGTIIVASWLDSNLAPPGIKWSGALDWIANWGLELIKGWLT